MNKCIMTSIIGLSAAISAQSIAVDYPFVLPEKIEATININTTREQAFNNKLLGTNIFGYSTAAEKAFINKLDPITVRFPHGLWSNWYDWRSDTTQIFGTDTFTFILPNGKTHDTVYLKHYSFQNSDIFTIPKKHYFFLGDNRDCSKDSRYLTSVGYVHENNLVGKAEFIFFSSDFRLGSIFSFWKWNETIRFNRFFKKII